MSCSLFSQEKTIKTTEIPSPSIEINTDGLDDIIIENTEDNQLKIILMDENPNSHRIFTEEENDVFKINFQLDFNTYKDEVFRKYITKRLQRASVVVKIPKNKDVIIYGKTIGVVSKSYYGNLAVYIDKGNVKLHQVQKNIAVKLFLGNVYAQLSSNNSIDVNTNKGQIVIDNKQIQHSVYKKQFETSSFNFEVKSINANVNLITK